FRANRWGLWQMHGNVYELCQDVWSDSHEGASRAGKPRQAPQQEGVAVRVVRGGSWDDDARDCRSAYRDGIAPVDRLGPVGFRPARGQAMGAQAGAAEPPDAFRGSERIPPDV
ncbi:MAG: SUMF1/EgtB/PvdO family nonheme iron enzyme, partial [Pseudomonadota bacterium]